MMRRSLLIAFFSVALPCIPAHAQNACPNGTKSDKLACLVPQVYSANRYELDLTPWPAIRAVNDRALQHPAFQAAHPDRQPDAVAVS